MGHDPATVVTAVGLDTKTLSDPDGRVPVSLAAAFFARAVEHTGDANLAGGLAGFVTWTELGAFVSEHGLRVVDHAVHLATYEALWIKSATDR